MIGIAIFGAIIVFLALRTVRGIEQSEAVAEGFEGLAGLCEGQAAPDGGRPIHGQGTADGEALRGVALRLVEGEWLYDATGLPVDWRAESAQEAEVVLCLGPSEPLITTACEVDVSGAAPTRVYGEVLAVRLLAAESGALLAEDVLASAGDAGCREEAGAVARVDVDMIEGWVRGVVGD